MRLTNKPHKNDPVLKKKIIFKMQKKIISKGKNPHTQGLNGVVNNKPHKNDPVLKEISEGKGKKGVFQQKMTLCVLSSNLIKSNPQGVALGSWRHNGRKENLPRESQRRLQRKRNVV